MIVIITPKDHAGRGAALAALTPGSRHVSIDAPVLPGNPPGGALTTITLWGHGEEHFFCGRKGGDIAKLIGDWKKVHPQIKTVEMITCNARHFSKTKAIADQVKSGLRAGFRNPCRDITVKALPVAVSGKRNAWSILLADESTRSWAYITAPGVTDAEMMKVVKSMTFTTTADGRSVSYRGDVAARAGQVLREAPPNRTWTLNYGYFNTLRACLGVV